MSRGFASPAQWRLASRLARREVRRRSGRTLLVVILIALPVMAMTVASILAHTIGGNASEFALRHGDDADVVAHVPDRWLDEVRPAGTEVDGATILRATRQATVPIFRDGEMVGHEWGVTLAETVPGEGSRLAITSGRAPGTGEIWVSLPLLADLNLEVGDELELQHPDGTWRIVSTGHNEAQYEDPVIAGPDLHLDDVRPPYRDVEVVVDLPPGDRAASDRAVNQIIGLSGSQRANWTEYHPSVERPAGQWRPHEGITPSTIAWGWVAGVIALGVVGIIIAAAFATSARRQLATLGQLSSNGAPPGLLTRTLALQGTWSGVLGSATGMVAGLLALLLGHGVIETISNESIGAYHYSVLDLLVIVLTSTVAATVAALIPARTAANVPALAALAGRRPLGVVPRRLVPIGLGLFALGLLFLMLAASSEATNTGGRNLSAIGAVFGGVAVALGMCCASPLAVGLMSKAAARVGRSWRFGGRSLARTPTRTAAVVTALGVTAAAALAGSAVAASSWDEDGPPDTQDWPDDAVVISMEREWIEARNATVDLPTRDAAVVPDVLREHVVETLPDAQWFDRREAIYDPAPIEFKNGRASRPRAWGRMNTDIVVADPAIMDLYEFSERDRELLDTYGALDLDIWSNQSTDPSGTSPSEITLPAEGGDITVQVGRRASPWGYSGRRLTDLEGTTVIGGSSGDTLLITEAKARALGLEIITSGAIVRNDEPLSATELDALNWPTDSSWAMSDYYVDVPRQNVFSAAPRWEVGTNWHDDRVSSALVQGAIIAAALLMTLIVVAIGLALAATESRDETDVLLAVGAKPKTMRRMAGVKAITITLTAGVLAIPTGLLPIAVVYQTTDEDFVMPWVAVGGIVVVVPLLAGGAAWLTSAIARRVRRESMANLAFE